MGHLKRSTKKRILASLKFSSFVSVSDQHRSMPFHCQPSTTFQGHRK